MSGAFQRVTVLGGSRVSGITPNHLGSTEIEYCWQPGSLNACAAILSRVRQLKPDLVWFNLGASVFGKSPLSNVSGSLTPMYARQMGFPTVVTLHELVEFVDLRALNAPGGLLAPLGARLLTNIATHADIICLTMLRYKELLARRQLDCAHIPIGAYHEPELLNEPGAPELLFFTTLAPFKGLELLIEAFCRLRQKYPRLKLNIAGTEHIRFPNYLGELRERFHNTDGIRWMGQIPEDQVRDLFRDSQIVVLPYTASTGSSSVLYQAATWGRAVVASDLDDSCTLARESNLQIEFFENGNIDSLCGSIQTLLDSPIKRRTQVEHNFKAILPTRPGETGRKYIHAFNRALEKRNSSKRILVPDFQSELA
jgi:glycosyltransferase involved in cell wall biosynthesis